jgi:hypothetical protein
MANLPRVVLVGVEGLLLGFSFALGWFAAALLLGVALA